MILKSMSRTLPGSSVKRLVQYISRGSAQGRFQGYNGCGSFFEDDDVIQAMESNESFAKARKRRVRFYHEVLAISSKDQCEDPAAVLDELVCKYFELRAPQGLGFWKIHLEPGKPAHAHIVLSGNQYASNRQMRISKFRMEKVKQGLELFQLERFPELKHSLTAHTQGRKIKDFVPVEESPVQKRMRLQGKLTGKPLKIELRQKLEQAMAQAVDLDALLNILGKQGLQLYRRGQSIGLLQVKTGRKHRVKTLGLAASLQKCLDRMLPVEQRKQALRGIKATKKAKQALNKQGEEVRSQVKDVNVAALEEYVRMHPADRVARGQLDLMKKREKQTLKKRR